MLREREKERERERERKREEIESTDKCDKLNSHLLCWHMLEVLAY